jgi:xanthine/uracil/vitamin C permease (AzgA family)
VSPAGADIGAFGVPSIVVLLHSASAAALMMRTTMVMLFKIMRFKAAMLPAPLFSRA